MTSKTKYVCIVEVAATGHGSSWLGLGAGLSYSGSHDEGMSAYAGGTGVSLDVVCA